MTTTKAEELAARAETLAIAEALERRFGCSALVLTADIERAAAELRRLSAENTAAVSSFLAADDERRELRAERDALLAAIPEGCTPADAAMLREANHQLAAERDAEQAAKAVPADLRSAAERTRQDLGPTGSNYPDVRVLLAFAEQALAAHTPPAPDCED